jgi:peroxiredoxin
MQVFHGRAPGGQVVHDIMRGVKTGQLAPDFELPDITGRRHRLSDYRGQIVVIHFWSCACPHVERTDALMTAWSARWGKGVVVMGIAPNRGETPEAIAAAAGERGLAPMLVDEERRVADLYGAVTTPEVFVIDGAGRLRYRGAVDDCSLRQRVPKRFYLKEAVEALLEHGTPGVSDTQPYGCAIIRHALE